MFLRSVALMFALSIASIVAQAAPRKTDKKAGPVQFGAWHVIGPFYNQGKNSFAVAFGPEKEIDLKKEYEAAGPDKGGLTRKLRWRANPKFVDGATNRISADTFGSTYAYRTITTDQARAITGYFGGDDGLAVWLNGKSVYSNNSRTALAPGSVRAKLKLSKGVNHLLMKIHNQRGGHWFYFSTSPSKQPAPKKKPRSPGPQTIANIGPNPEAMRLAIEDLMQTFPKRYTKGAEYLARLTKLEETLKAAEADAEKSAAVTAELGKLRREAMLANPLLDFDELLVVRRNFGDKARRVISASLGLPSLNSRTHDTIPPTGWDNEIAVMSDLRGAADLRTLYKPDGGKILSNVDLHFDAERMMYSSIGTHDRWAIFEIDADGRNPRQFTPKDLPDVDHFDSCYLPSDEIVFTSTACFQGLPCENGKRPMALLYRMDAKAAPSSIRQLTFEQDSDWSPVVRPDGRLMYLRWEYTDTPHYFSRILFHSNPDGTEQMEYYGSNSCFPNALFYARPIPGHPSQVIGIISGHHGVSRSGRLLIFDPSRGRQEADGVVQEIPGRGKTVEPLIKDRLVDGVWPQFLHPYPLSGTYHLVAAKPSPNALWGIYLVDVFDNMTLVKEVESAALLEPVPFRKTPRPPVIPDKFIAGRKDAIAYLADIHQGDGLKDVPRGTVKKLRIIAYHFAHIGSGGHTSVGVESSWDVKRVLGTVPVEKDGSAMFRIPANTPISLQPLDEQGRALQLMRSWMVGMPGEIVSCVGCHEKQNQGVPNRRAIAAARAPSEIRPWYGPPRPFAFRHEVQPVLDEYCVGCHNGEKRVDGTKIPNFTGNPQAQQYKQDGAYMALQEYARRPGPESDIHMTEPLEYHASTSELIQMLEKGHHNVKLRAEAWQKLYAWIDLNVPYRGRWAPKTWRDRDQDKRRRELAKMYANVDTDPEREYEFITMTLANRPATKPVVPAPAPSVAPVVPTVAGWPFNAAGAAKRQAAAGAPARKTIDLGGGGKMEMVRIPAGEFVMGSVAGDADERPLARVTIDRPFWMSVTEVTNAQFARFDASHDSRYIDIGGKDHSTRGFPANQPTQPVIRVTWNRATEFCRWMSEQAGATVALPTEAQWEWACRAGSNGPTSYGDLDADFGKYANLADKTASGNRTVGKKGGLAPFPTDDRSTDGQKIVTTVGAYQPNAWGLHDVHGNVAEWTRTAYRPYPYDGADGRNAPDAAGRKVVRGGSWRDRPKRATSSFRLAYPSYQRVVNVGFRVILEDAK